MIALKKDKLTSFIEGLVLILFFALPFERIPTIEYAGFTLKISYILSLIFLILILFSKKYFINSINKWKTSDYFLTCLWISGLVSLFFSKDIKRSLVVLLLWLFMFLLYYFLSWSLTQKTLIRKIENYIIFTSVIICIFGSYQFFGDWLGLSPLLTGLRERYTKDVLGFTRIQSVALEPLYFANYLLIPIFLSIKKYLFEWKLKTQIVKKILNKYFFVLILLFTNFILTTARGAYIALIISMLIFILYLFYRSYREKKEFKNISQTILSIALATFISLIISFILVGVTDGTTKNFTAHVAVNDSTNEVSVNGRKEGVIVAYNKFKTSPIFGIGVGTSGLLDKPVVDHGEILTYGTLNNLYFEILAECGVTGFSFFILFIFFFLKEFHKQYTKSDKNKQLSLFVLFLGLLAVFIQYNFFSTLYIIYIWAFLALLRGEMYEEN